MLPFATWDGATISRFNCATLSILIATLKRNRHYIYSIRNRKIIKFKRNRTRKSFV